MTVVSGHAHVDKATQRHALLTLAVVALRPLLRYYLLANLISLQSGHRHCLAGGRLLRSGALNATVVPELPFPGSGAGRAAQGRASAQGYGRSGVFRAVESARGGLLVKSARRGDRASGRLHPAGRREGCWPLART